MKYGYARILTVECEKIITDKETRKNFVRKGARQLHGGDELYIKSIVCFGRNYEEIID